MANTLFDVTQISQLPNAPGVYKFFNGENTIIYVGKAKDLRKRVASYFSKSHIPNRKTLRMVREIKGIEITIVDSEFDALLLENNLIKENQPRYNIQLKDDKSFPYIVITKERFPRIYYTRRVNTSKGEYFGPYTRVKAMKSVLDLIRKLYTIRTCTLNLSEENVAKGKYKVCLEYHLGNCLGPCEGLQTEAHYMEEIDNSRQILKGNIGVVKQYFKGKMQEAAGDLNFERAQNFKEKLEHLEKFQIKSLIVNQKLTAIDVFAIVSDEKKAFINFLRIKDGAIILTDTIEVKKKLDEQDEEILQIIIQDFKHKLKGLNQEILVNIAFESWDDSLNIRVPQRGDKKKLVELSIKNALFYKKEKLNEQAPTRENRVLVTLQRDLRLKSVPMRIECFDNSNFQGTNPVASMVSFHNGKPAKKEYRHYNIKTVVGPDDFKSMKEIVGRRYKRLVEEEEVLPDLIVIDGGKGQLNAACEALKELKVYGKIAIIGIAKRLEEIYFPEDPLPLHISKKSESLKLLQRVRDEAHRFAITFHRSKRSKASTHSELDEIKGIGKKTREKLLSEFKSVKKIKDIDVEELSKLVGAKKAELIKTTLK